MLKKAVKYIIARRAQRDVVPLKNLIYLGSVNHGYTIPANYLSRNSVCYCVGAGTDISLDVEVATKFKSRVFIFDPMPYALAHFNGLVASASQGEAFAADNNPKGYVYTASAEELAAITYCPIGVWNEKKLIRFYSPARDNYAGHSITNLQHTAQYIEAPVDTLANSMRALGHQQLDLLKIEIEGSEYTVIDNVIADKLAIKMILVEFDEFHHRKGLARLAAIRHIEQSSQKLFGAGYKLVHSTSFYKRTFVRADVVQELQSQE